MVHWLLHPPIMVKVKAACRCLIGGVVARGGGGAGGLLAFGGTDGRVSRQTVFKF